MPSKIFSGAIAGLDAKLVVHPDVDGARWAYRCHVSGIAEVEESDAAASGDRKQFVNSLVRECSFFFS